MSKGHVIRSAPELKDVLAPVALQNYFLLLPDDNVSDEAKELYEKKRLLCAAVAFAYVANDASRRASDLKKDLQDLSAYKAPDYSDGKFPLDYPALSKLFSSLQRAAPVLLVPNEHTIYFKDKLTKPSAMFGSIPLQFADEDKASVGSILNRIEQNFFIIGVHETIYRLFGARYLPILRGVLGRPKQSAKPLNEGAHPRDFGQKRFVHVYETYLEQAIQDGRESEDSAVAFCKEDKALLSEYENYQTDILTRTMEPTESITTRTVRLPFFFFS